MPSTNRRTWQQFHVGHLNITVQLDSTAQGHSTQRHQELAHVIRGLITTMNNARLPATWAVSDPVHSAATSLLIKSAVEHELAILGDGNWVGPTAGRTRFARELVRRVTQARATGINVTSLVPSVASVESHIDLVVKQQITAVAGLAEATNAHPHAEPLAMHYGVWELPVSASLPIAPTWFSSGKRSAWRGIRRAAADAGSFHLLIDAAAIAESGRHEETAIAWLARRISTLRDRGLIRIETMRATAARLSNVPAVSPQRSILRAAA